VASLGVTLFYSAGMLMVVHLRGVSLVYWVYPTIDRRLLRAASRWSRWRSTASAGGAGGDPAVATGAGINLLTIVVTAALVNLFAYIFAYRTACRTRSCIRRWSWIS
jgi:diguanylate cyclase